MQSIARFEKVSLDQFTKDFASAFPEKADNAASIYSGILLPRRATTGSACYDFFIPFDAHIAPGETLLIPSGIRVAIDPGWVLMLFPRSGLGFKYRFQLDNSVGIIDSDYWGAKNEGHIFLKMTNDTHSGKEIVLRCGEGIAQGIFVPFGITSDDSVSDIRTGGFGSTTRKDN